MSLTSNFHSINMTYDVEKVEVVLKRVQDTLDTAKQGLLDMAEPSRSRRNTGLRNFIAFARSVTFVIQNLRSVSGIDFDAWYLPHQEKMKADPLMKYFIEARNELEKQGKLSVGTSVSIQSFSTSDIAKFGRPPVGAKGFFIGDQLGGSGWEVELADGTTEKYYVDLPLSIGEVKQQFTNFPSAKAPELASRSVDDLCHMYLATLEALVQDAKNNFLEHQVTSEPKKRPNHLRLVK